MQEYIESETPAEKRNLLRFLVFAAYSLHAMLRFTTDDFVFSGGTLAIGIGSRSRDMIGDMRCYKKLYASLALVFESGMDSVLWLIVSHSLPRDNIVEAMRNIVCARALRPTRANIEMVVGMLARSHGNAGIRGRWRQTDAFASAALHPLSFMYCGSKVLHAHLRSFAKLQAVARNLAEHRGKTVFFSDIVRSIAKPRLQGYARGGYWAVHLARLLDPAFSGICLYAGIEYRPECVKKVYDMGNGARAMSNMGIQKAGAADKVPRLCQCIEKLGRWYGHDVSMNAHHLASASCEASRRGVFGTGAVRRRPGL